MIGFFSIRELMIMMNIPKDFKWLALSLDELNALSKQEKQRLAKQNEMNIRQSIGEAVPSIIFRQIADKIKQFMQEKNLNDKEILEQITKYDLQKSQNLKKYIVDNLGKISRACLSNLAEIANSKRTQNSAYFTNKFRLYFQKLLTC